MATYTAQVSTAYGVIDVEHDGTPTDEELIRMAHDKLHEQEKLATINNSIATGDMPEVEEPTGFTTLPAPSEPEEEEEDDLVADIAKGFMRVAEIPRNLVMEQVLGMSGLGDVEREALRKTFEGEQREQFLDTVAKLSGVVTGAESDIKERVIDEQGDFKPTTTLTGVGLEVAPYIAGGTKLATTTFSKLPTFVSALASGATIDSLLYKEGEGSLAGLVEEADLLEKGILKDFVEFMSVDDDDSIAEQRFKVALEGMIVAGVAEPLLKVFGFILPKGETVANQAKSAVQYLKQAREDVAINRSNIHQDLQFSEDAKSLAQIEQQNSSFLKRFQQQVFSSRGYFTTNAYNLFRGKEYAERQLVREAENIATRLTKALDRLPVDFVPEEKLMDFLTANLSSSSDYYKGLITKGEYQEAGIATAEKMGIPGDVAVELLNARNLIDTLSSRIANSNIPNEELKEAIVRNAGSYIRRSYRLFEDSGFKPDESLKHQVVKKIQASMMKADKSLTEEKAYSQALGKVDSILDRTTFEGLNHFEKAVKVNKEILSERKDINEDIRKLMGEITNPADSIIVAVDKMARLVETNKFADNLIELGRDKYIFDVEETVGNVKYNLKITGTDSALDGKFTTPEMAKAIAGRQAQLVGQTDIGFLDKTLGFLMEAKGTSQAMKTVLSHVTHLRNILGGAQFGLANGLNPFANQKETRRILGNAIKRKGDAGLDALYERYLGLGVINTNVRVNEFRKLMQEGAEMDGSAAKFFEAFSGYGLGAKEGAESLAGKTGELALKGYRRAQDIYVATDDFYKINAFEKELEVLQRAFPNEAIEVLEKKAASIVQNTFPNYDMVPNGIKAFKYLPIGSFVSFPAEIVRTSIKIVKQASDEITSGNAVIAARGRRRLASFTASMGAWEGIATTASYLAGITNEEEEAIQNISHTPWSKATRIPVRGSDGTLFVADTQFIDSYSTIKEPIKEIYHAINSGELRGEELESQLLDAAYNFYSKATEAYTDQAIITEAISDVYYASKNSSGRTPEGKQLFVGADDPINNFINGASHIISSMLPGSVDSLSRLLVDADATGIGEMYYGKSPTVSKATGNIRYDKRAELLANLTGIRFSRLDPEDSLYYAYQKFKDDKRSNFSKKINYGDKPEEIEEEQKKNLLKDYESQQDLYLMYRSVSDLIGEERAFMTLIDAGMSQESVSMLAENAYFDSDYLEGRVNDLEKLGGATEEVQQMINNIILEQSKYRHTQLIPVDESRRAQQQRLIRAKGGEVYNVPQVPIEPDERIDKLTGRPYNEQAGEAFTDEEDRMGFSKGSAIVKGLTKIFGKQADEARNVMPAPQRFFDPEDKDFKPFLGDMGEQPGGRYLEMGAEGPTDITGEFPEKALIGVTPEGKPVMQVSRDLLEGETRTDGRKIKTNLFKKKAGWKWTQVPEGFDPEPPSNFPLVSVEDGKQHYYTLQTEFPEGVELTRYEKSKSEPRLRPTKKGNVHLGNKVGEISVRGKKHPVYDKIEVYGLVGASTATMMEDKDRNEIRAGGITRRYAVAKGGLPKDMYRRDGSIKSAQGFLGPIKNLETGKTMTELSIDLEMGGKNVQIPTMVPTLTDEEIKILQSQNWEGKAKELPRSIVRKAVDHARKRMDAGLNPFYQDDEGREAKAKGGKIDKKKMACNSPKRTPGHPKKSHVVKACESGKEKIIRFGEQGAKTAGKPKAGESARMKAKRKSFKARHAKNIKRGKMSAAYWADKVKW